MGSSFKKMQKMKFWLQIYIWAYAHTNTRKKICLKQILTAQKITVYIGSNVQQQSFTFIFHLFDRRTFDFYNSSQQLGERKPKKEARVKPRPYSDWWWTFPSCLFCFKFIKSTSKPFSITERYFSVKFKHISIVKMT